MDSITNQTVAVGVLITILGGLGWLIKQIFGLLPSLMDRMDKKEEQREKSIICLAERIENNFDKNAQRIEASINKLNDKLTRYTAETQDHIKQSNEIQTQLTFLLKHQQQRMTGGSFNPPTKEIGHKISSMENGS